MPQATYPPVPDTARIDLRYTLGGDFGGVEIENSVYWFDDTVTRDAAYLSALSDDVLSAWEATGSLQEGLLNLQTLDVIKVSDLNTVPHLVFENAVDEAGTGGTTAALPATVCAIVRLPVLNPGLPLKTYLRHGVLGEVQVSGNTMVEASADVIRDAWKAFFGELQTSQATGAAVAVSVYNPGGSGATRYRDAGIVNPILTAEITVRGLIGRSVSRLS